MCLTESKLLLWMKLLSSQYFGLGIGNGRNYPQLKRLQDSVELERSMLDSYRQSEGQHSISCQFLSVKKDFQLIFTSFMVSVKGGVGIFYIELRGASLGYRDDFNTPLQPRERAEDRHDFTCIEEFQEPTGDLTLMDLPLWADSTLGQTTRSRTSFSIIDWLLVYPE